MAAQVSNELCCTKQNSIVTDRIRRIGEGNIFTLCVSPHLNRGGTPSQVWNGGIGYHIPGLDKGVPHPRSGWWGVPPSQDWIGYPPPPTSTGWGAPPIRQCRLGSTCYVKGGMPLAFMQENFLVNKYPCK